MMFAMLQVKVIPRLSHWWTAPIDSFTRDGLRSFGAPTNNLKKLWMLYLYFEN